VGLAVFKTVARPFSRSRVGSTPMHLRQLSHPDYLPSRLMLRLPLGPLADTLALPRDVPEPTGLGI
jgi:hypothetical protein